MIVLDRPQSVRLCGWSDTQTCLPELCRHASHSCTSRMYYRRTGTDDKRGRMDCQQEKSLFIKGNSNDRVETWSTLFTSHQPSPNLPNDQSIRLYASLCPFEATRVSVGRGTTFPFQVLGAPNKKYGSFHFYSPLLTRFDKNPMHKGITCYGEDLRNVTDVNGFTLRYFLDFYRLSGENAAFFSRARWFDLLMGTDSVRKAILKGESEEAIRNNWQKELQDYKEIRKKHLLYE